MKGEIVRTTTDDGLVLHGILYEPREKPATGCAVIHVHGTYSNFYKGNIREHLTSSYNDIGVSFLCVNTRGHDIATDLYGPRGIIRIGGAYEVFQECTLDITAWIKLARERGHDRIVLEGHSLGAMKVMYFLAQNPNEVDGLILISPPDHLTLHNERLGDRYDEILELAHELAREDESTLMPDDAHFGPISAGSYVSKFGSPEDTGMFTYRDLDLMRRAGIGAIQCPVMATFGTVEEAIAIPAEECIASLGQCVPNPDLLTCKVLEGANHVYYLYEQKLSEVLANWLVEKLL